MSIAPAAEVPESSGRPVWALTGEEIVGELDILHVELTRIQTRRLTLLAALDSLGHAKEIGARNTADFLARRHRLDSQAVHHDVKLARTLARYPTVQAALSNGPNVPGPDPAAEAPLGLHVRQAEAIVSSLERAPRTVPVEDLQVAESAMVIAAQTVPPADLRRIGRGAVERLDPDGREPKEKDAHARQRLTMTRNYTGDGIRFRGFLANENAELFQTLIDACSKPHKTTDSQGREHLDPRNKSQRQADALVHILNTAAASTIPAGDDGASIGIPAHGGIRPHIMVTIRLEDLIKAGRQHTGDLLFGDRLSASAVRMLACDAGIPIILGTNSQPLDVGREHRSVTPAIRTALIARDKGCVICHAPPAWCDAHHLVQWADGGNTSLDNTVLLCKPDHRATHQGTWHIQIVEGAVHVTGPHYKPRKTRNTPSERPPP